MTNSNRTFPKPNLIDEPLNVSMDLDDVYFILRDKLKPEHLSSPLVIKFITEYVQFKDLSRAAEVCGLTKRQARVLRSRSDIFSAISAITATSVMKYDLDPNEVVEKVKDIAYVDPASMFDEEGAIIENMHDIPLETRRSIKKFEVKNLYEDDANGIRQVVGKLVKVEMWDKLKASELLSREVGVFKETKVVEHGVTKDMKDVLLESRRRAEQRNAEVKELPSTPVEYKDISGTEQE